jgi:hypothetical protein
MRGGVLHIVARNHDVALNGAHGQILHYLIYKVLAFVGTADGGTVVKVLCYKSKGC